MEDNSVTLKGHTDSSGQSVPCPESYGHHNLGSVDYSENKITQTWGSREMVVDLGSVRGGIKGCDNAQNI